MRRFSIPLAVALLLCVRRGIVGRRLSPCRTGRAARADRPSGERGRDDAGQAVASGVYMARLEAGAVRQMRKMVLLK